jgi:hypothetical protein
MEYDNGMYPMPAYKYAASLPEFELLYLWMFLRSLDIASGFVWSLTFHVDISA